MSESKDTSAARWAVEYENGGIPSSIRETPSGAVVWAYDELHRRGYPLRTAVDVGCGKGRNSLFLAKQGMTVTAMDFTPNAVRHTNEAATQQGLTDKIHAIVHDVTEPWLVPNDSVDLVVDAFCFKHIAPSEARAAYKQSLLRALATRGHYMISFASIGDGYYGQYLTQPADDGAGEGVVIDPVNGIESVIYSRKRVVQFFAPELDLLSEIQNDKPSQMHGETYPRSTYALLFRRNPHVL